MFRNLSRAVSALALFVAIFSTGLTLVPTASAQTDHLALITDLDGPALVAKADQSDFVPAVWGMQLFAGDRIKTEDDAEVSILFSNNNMIVLGANSAMTITAGPGASGESSVKAIEEDLYGTLASLRHGSESNGRGRALAGLRAGSDAAALRLVSPRNTKLKDLRPAFAWHTEKEYDTYIIRLYDASGLVWSRQVEGTRLDYPEDEAPLVAGSSYFWDVEGQTLLDGEPSEKVGFSILSEEDLHRVQAQEVAFENILDADANSTNYQFAVGAFYAREGLVESAIASFEEIAERHPKAVLPHEIMGRLYEEIGLEELALAELHRAVALSQAN